MKKYKFKGKRTSLNKWFIEAVKETSVAARLSINAENQKLGPALFRFIFTVCMFYVCVLCYNN